MEKTITIQNNLLSLTLNNEELKDLHASEERFLRFFLIYPKDIREENVISYYKSTVQRNVYYEVERNGKVYTELVPYDYTRKLALSWFDRNLGKFLRKRYISTINK